MAILNANLIKLQSGASSKEDAISEAVSLLVAEGKIDPRYGESMMERETVANTFLGNGIAIPHGVPKDRDLILETAIAVVQCPQGVEWGPDASAKIIVAIAAKSDEHLDILSNLTDVVGDTEAADKLINTLDKADILRCLGGTDTEEAVAPVAQGLSLDGFQFGFETTVPGAHGLHARPATYLVDLTKQYSADIRLSAGEKVADAKSLMSLLKLGATHNAAVQVWACGDDAAAAFEAIKTAFETGLGEADELNTPLSSQQLRTETENKTASSDPKWEGAAVLGISASPGLAIAPVFQWGREQFFYEDLAQDKEHELQVLRDALLKAQQQLDELYADVLARSGEKQAEIFKAHKELLSDSDLGLVVEAHLEAGKSAAFAWDHATREEAATLAAMDSPLLAARAADLKDIGNRVLRFLTDQASDAKATPSSDCIIVADDLTPSETAQLDVSLVRGLCTAQGGPTSHTAIIARALDIPAVVGVGANVLSIPTGQAILLDGVCGALITNPTEKDRADAQKAITSLAQQKEQDKQNCFKPALMKDGVRVEVVANISDLPDAVQTVEAGGEGVGLLRTEFLFLHRETEPTEAEQEEVYAGMVKALNGLPIIIRTLDVGGDKEIPYLDMPREDNPFLGERGIRFCLARPQLFRSQLRAILNASKFGPVRIMYPMISQLDELLEAKRITEEVRLEVGVDPVEIGMMIEVPSAVAMASVFAQHVDFFSIGTNDLTQYTLAMDRLHPDLAKQADGLDPAVLRFIDQTVRAADAAGIWVGACGGIAGDPLGATILSGLGLKELSMSIPTIAEIKALLRGQSFEANRALALKALEQPTAQAVRQLALNGAV